jgi:hypothetical protein
MVKLGLLNLVLYEVALGLEMVVWKVFWTSATFARAREITQGITTSLGMPPLYIWGFAFMIAGMSLAFIFTDGWWVVGLVGEILSFLLMTGLALSFLFPVHMTTVPLVDGPSLFGTTTAFFIALEFVEMIPVTWIEHRSRS